MRRSLSRGSAYMYLTLIVRTLCKVHHLGLVSLTVYTIKVFSVSDVYHGFHQQLGQTKSKKSAARGKDDIKNTFIWFCLTAKGLNFCCFFCFLSSEEILSYPQLKPNCIVGETSFEPGTLS